MESSSKFIWDHYPGPLSIENKIIDEIGAHCNGLPYTQKNHTVEFIASSFFTSVKKSKDDASRYRWSKFSSIKTCAASGQMRLIVNSLHNRWGLTLSEGVL